MDPREALERAVASTGAVVHRVQPDMFDLPTPCSEWTVRQLLNHLVGQLWALQGRLAETQPRLAAPPGALPYGDIVGDGAGGAYDEVARAVTAASHEPGALERAGFALGAYATDTLVHGWDLATATGQDVRFDDDLAAHCLDVVRSGITADNRAPAFAAEVTAPSGASPIEELVAFCGRAPR